MSDSIPRLFLKYYAFNGKRNSHYSELGKGKKIDNDHGIISAIIYWNCYNSYGHPTPVYNWNNWNDWNHLIEE